MVDGTRCVELWKGVDVGRLYFAHDRRLWRRRRKRRECKEIKRSKSAFGRSLMEYWKEKIRVAMVAEVSIKMLQEKRT
jgi:hypothetical protein